MLTKSLVLQPTALPYIVPKPRSIPRLMPIRPPLHSIPQSSSSALSTYHGGRRDLYPLFAQIAFHVVPGKLDGVDLERIYSIVDELGGRCVGIEDSRLILTALRGRPRLERALGKRAVDSKVLLRVEYVYDTFDACVLAAHNGTIPELPVREYYTIRVPAKREREEESEDVIYLGKKARFDVETVLDNVFSESSTPHSPAPVSTGEPSPPLDGQTELGDITLYPPDIRFENIPRYCVQRPCPLICPNQDMVDAIRPIYEEREFEELDQKNSNVLSYRRSIGILKCTSDYISVPRRINSGAEALKLQDLGEKVANRIDEFLETGQIAESENILASERYQTLRLFASIHTIGHHTARDLYERYHCKTLNDVKAHYQNIAEEAEEVRLKVKDRRRREGGMTHVDIVEAWMAVKDDLAVKIPRAEVEEIAKCVMSNLDALLPGCLHTICGGYRRGKDQCGDVDIVICPPQDAGPDADIGLLRDLYRRLSTLGIITHVLHATERELTAPVKAHPNNFDNLDKVFVIFKLPGPGRKHRRVDIISAPRERYAAAILSWSGSMMFERDLRRYAEEKGFKFRAGLQEANTGREINFNTEREIFQHLGLRYVPPELRNADG